MSNKQIWKKKPKDKNQQPVKTTPIHVPEGHYFWKAEEKQKARMSVIMDQDGEIFLLDKISRKVYWSYQTEKPSYFLYKAKDVDDYIDYDGEMRFPYRHHGNLSPEVISFRSSEHLRERLLEVYRAGIYVEENTSYLGLDYHTGTIGSDETKEKLLIELHHYDTKFSSPETSSLKWHLKFTKVKVTFPNSECPCTVHHARTVYEFVDLCSQLGIEELPGGRLVEDLRWEISCQLNKIVLDPHKNWVNDKRAGWFERREVDVIRVKKSVYNLGKIRNLRVNEDESDRMLHFYGWEPTDEYYYLAFERCVSLDEFRKSKIDNTPDVNLLRLLAHAVYSLHAKGIGYKQLSPQNVFVNHYGEPKLGWCTFITEEGQDYTTDILNILGRIMLYYASGGAYRFIENEVKVSPEQYKLCNIPELRDLIEKLTKSPPGRIQLVLAHPWQWDVHTTISFITTFSDYLNNYFTSYDDISAVDQALLQNNVFKSPWNSVLDTGFVNERVNARTTKYDYTRGSSLVTIMRNAFNHHDEMAKAVQEKVGDTKEKMLLYFRGKFPDLIPTLYSIGRKFVQARNLRIFYEH